MNLDTVIGSEFTKTVIVFRFYFVRPYSIREWCCYYSIVFIAGKSPMNYSVCTVNNSKLRRRIQASVTAMELQI